MKRPGDGAQGALRQGHRDLSQARELFDALRRLDELGAKKVYARMPRKTGVGMAVYNRLIRAAAFSHFRPNPAFFLSA